MNDIKSLSPLIRKYFNMSDTGECVFYIPSVCFWEINRKLSSKGIRIKGLSPEDGIRLAHKTIDNSQCLRDLPLTRKAASLAPSFRTKLPDPFDQLIVASALDANLALITRDQAIQKSGLVQVVW